MYTETQLSAIKMFGRKDLSFGCLFKYPNQWDDDILTMCCLYDDTGSSKTLSFLSPDKESTWEINYFTEDTEIEILGHEPHLEDLFRVAEEKNKISKFEMNVDRDSRGVLYIRIYAISKTGNMLINYTAVYHPEFSILSQPNLQDILDIFLTK